MTSQHHFMRKELKNFYASINDANQFRMYWDRNEADEYDQLY